MYSKFKFGYTQIVGPCNIFMKGKNLILTLWPDLSDSFLEQKSTFEKNTFMHIKYGYYIALLCHNLNVFAEMI